MQSTSVHPIRLLVPAELVDHLRSAADASGRPLEDFVLDAVTERVDPDYEHMRIVLSEEGFDALLRQLEQPIPPDAFDGVRRLLHAVEGG